MSANILVWVSCHFSNILLAPQWRENHSSSQLDLLWFSHPRFMFEAQILTGLWWVLWQTLQPYFPQRVSAFGIPAYPGSPSQCTQSLFLKIRSVFWENRDFICSGRRKAGYSGLADLGVWTICGLCSLNSFLNNGAQDIESPGERE